MKKRVPFVLILSILAWQSLASRLVADGLIFSLPADGTWAEYSGTSDSNFKVNFPPEMLAHMDEAGKAKMRAFLGPQKLLETVRVSSVGVDKYGGQPCRWIELQRSSKRIDPDTKQQTPKRDLLLKLLAPEKDLTRGGNLLDDSYLAFFNPKEVDMQHIPDDPGFDRIRYEIERFLICFPPPLRDEERLPAETIITPVGTFKDCDVIRGKAKFSRPLMNDGIWNVESMWTIALHHEAPFGVVRLKSEESSAEAHGTGHPLQGTVERELMLSAKGDKAVTSMPEAKRKVLPVTNK